MMTFIGQAVASVTMTCQTMSAPSEFPEPLMDSTYMDHSQHMSMASADSNSPDSSAPDSKAPECNTDCDCSLGGCSVAVVPVTQQVFVANPSLLSNEHVTLAEKQLANSLYRPPIFR